MRSAATYCNDRHTSENFKVLHKSVYNLLLDVVFRFTPRAVDYTSAPLFCTLRAEPGSAFKKGMLEMANQSQDSTEQSFLFIYNCSHLSFLGTSGHFSILSANIGLFSSLLRYLNLQPLLQASNPLPQATPPKIPRPISIPLRVLTAFPFAHIPNTSSKNFRYSTCCLKLRPSSEFNVCPHGTLGKAIFSNSARLSSLPQTSGKRCFIHAEVTIFYQPYLRHLPQQPPFSSPRLRIPTETETEMPGVYLRPPILSHSLETSQSASPLSTASSAPPPRTPRPHSPPASTSPQT
jgi:hypothetical protein